MEQTRTLQGELTVTLFADQIRCVANVRDVLDAVGVDSIDEIGDNDYAELHIWI